MTAKSDIPNGAVASVARRPPVRVKLRRINADRAKAYPPDGETKAWWEYAIADFAGELLAVADNLQRTIAAAERPSPETIEDAALLEGVRATERSLMHALERFGVRKIEALGAPFDPALHEAVMEVDDGSYPPGSVARVLEDGYMIHDRLLRAARVAVAKRR
jgi:molecular chaperone GrpE